MSSTVAGVLPFEYAQLGSAPSPLEYPLPASVVVQLTAATATFDGTDAAGNFLACLSFYDQAGNKIVRVFPQTPVPAGEVADVNYAPFPGGLINPSAGGSIDTTDGSTDVNPTSELFIAPGLTLTNPSAGEAQIGVTAGPLLCSLRWSAAATSEDYVLSEFFTRAYYDGSAISVFEQDDFTMTCVYAATAGQAISVKVVNFDNVNAYSGLINSASIQDITNAANRQTFKTVTPTPIPAGSLGTYLPWTAGYTGAALVDLTDPAQPVWLNDGLYAVNVNPILT